MTLKPLTISLSDNDMARWKQLGPYLGEAWKFWKEVFSRLPALNGLGLRGSDKQILHMKYVKGNEFRIEYSDRKLSDKAVKAVKIMEKFH